MMALTEPEKTKLLGIARSALESRLGPGEVPDFDPDEPALASDAGAFVSLHRGGHLRGCIGVFSSDEPLYRTVVSMAIAAATQDPRFIPVTAEELASISIEISVLSPMKKIEDVTEIEVGRHGIYIIKGVHRGVLLPQVAVEHGFDRYTFLDQTCMKAGLAPGEWREGAGIYIFEAEIFKEE